MDKEKMIQNYLDEGYDRLKDEQMESSAEEMNREMRQKRSCDFCQETFREVELSECKVDNGEKVCLCENCLSEFDELKSEYLADSCDESRAELGID